MKEYKQILRMTILSVQEQLRNVNLYIFLLCVFFFLQICLSGGADYLSETGQRMNLFEIYICLMSSRTSQIIYLLGILLVNGGVLFYNQEAPYYLIRTNREKWAISQIIYLVVILLFYNIFLLINCWYAIRFQITTLGGWSRASVIASQSLPDVIGMIPILHIPAGLLEWNPNFLALFEFVLVMLMGVSVGVFMICFQYKNHMVNGVALIILLWYLDLLVENMPMFSCCNYISFFGLSRLERLSINKGGPSLIYALLFLSCFLIFLIKLNIYISKKLDFVKLE